MEEKFQTMSDFFFSFRNVFKLSALICALISERSPWLPMMQLHFWVFAILTSHLRSRMIHELLHVKAVISYFYNELLTVIYSFCGEFITERLTYRVTQIPVSVSCHFLLGSWRWAGLYLVNMMSMQQNNQSDSAICLHQLLFLPQTKSEIKTTSFLWSWMFFIGGRTKPHRWNFYNFIHF